MMYRNGPVLFGTQWYAPTAQLKASAALILGAASEPAVLAQADE